MSDPFFRYFFGGQGDGGQARPHRENWLGCGVVVAPDGYILTANHVVEGADEIKVNLPNDKTYSAKVIGLDPPTDVAILKIDAKNLPAVTLGDSDQLEVGDVVLAIIGNPFGIGQTVTRGIISALGRSLTTIQMTRTRLTCASTRTLSRPTPPSMKATPPGGALIDAQRPADRHQRPPSHQPQRSQRGHRLSPCLLNMARNVMNGFLKSGRVARGFMGHCPPGPRRGPGQGVRRAQHRRRDRQRCLARLARGQSRAFDWRCHRGHQRQGSYCVRTTCA